jgi:4-hydroxy 2-oxovalerate aldolase
MNNYIEVGFHAHDNCSNATCKALHSLKFGATIIDGCSLGYGRGSGNAKTELLLMDLNKNRKKNYDFINIMEFGDNYLINYKECLNNLCYNIVYALASYFGFSSKERNLINLTEFPKREFKFTEMTCSEIYTPKRKTMKQ